MNVPQNSKFHTKLDETLEKAIQHFTNTFHITQHLRSLVVSDRTVPHDVYMRSCFYRVQLSVLIPPSVLSRFHGPFLKGRFVYFGWRSTLDTH